MRAYRASPAPQSDAAKLMLLRFPHDARAPGPPALQTCSVAKADGLFASSKARQYPRPPAARFLVPLAAQNPRKVVLQSRTQQQIQFWHSIFARLCTRKQHFSCCFLPPTFLGRANVQVAPMPTPLYSFIPVRVPATSYVTSVASAVRSKTSSWISVVHPTLTLRCIHAAICLLYTSYFI